MELELGLALVPPPMKGFDLNATWLDHEADQKKKPMFPLVSWNGMPNEEEDDHKREKERTSSITTDNDEGDESGVIGWPPIKSWRKKLFHGHGQQVGRIITDHRMAAAAAERGGGGGTSNFRTNSTYVKVKMEGVGIARKIDLRLYRSYQTLTRSLITMFTKYQQIDKDSAHYTLLYQDNEGDWLLAGDVPWQTFIESVQRMEILRSAG